MLFAWAVGHDHDLVVGTALAGAGVFVFSVQGAMLLPLAVEMRNGTVGLSDVIRQGLRVGGWALLILVGAGLDAFAIQIAVVSCCWPSHYCSSVATMSCAPDGIARSCAHWPRSGCPSPSPEWSPSSTTAC